MESSLKPEALSSVVLEIYAATRCGEVAEYQRRALEVVGKHIAFDSAWWGRGINSGGERRVFCSFPYRMPEDVGERMNTTDANNIVVRRVVANPRKAFYFSQDDLRSQPSTSKLTDHMGIEQSLCIGDQDPLTGASTFISVARRRPTPRFAQRDLRALELLAPHLAAGLDMALSEELTAQRNPGATALIATDATGWLRAGEPAVTDMLRSEWPGWVGPRLPGPLVAWIAARKGDYLGRHLHASLHWHGDHAFVSVRRRDVRDRLTRREREVAAAFSSGQSYREVAEELGLAPATVRHHLRSVYAKLGVTEKATFALRWRGK